MAKEGIAVKDKLLCTVFIDDLRIRTVTECEGLNLGVDTRRPIESDGGDLSCDFSAGRQLLSNKHC